jgi:hypothetical protein
LESWFKIARQKRDVSPLLKHRRKGGEPKAAALRSELLRNVFLIFWGQKNELSIDR